MCWKVRSSNEHWIPTCLVGVLRDLSNQWSLSHEWWRVTLVMEGFILSLSSVWSLQILSFIFLLILSPIYNQSEWSCVHSRILPFQLHLFICSQWSCWGGHIIGRNRDPTCKGHHTEWDTFNCLSLSLWPSRSVSFNQPIKKDIPHLKNIWLTYTEKRNGINVDAVSQD